MKTEKIFESLRLKNLPSEEDIIHIVTAFKKEFSESANIVSIESPLTVVGDINGDFSSLMSVFDIAGHPPYNKFLFLGRCYVVCNVIDL